MCNISMDYVTNIKETWTDVQHLNGLCDKHIHGLVQDSNNSSELAMELLQTCPKPWIYKDEKIFALIIRIS